MNYAYVSNDQGDVRWISSKLNEAEGFTAYEVEGFDPSVCWFDGEQVQTYTQEQLTLKQDVPAYPAKWNNTSMSWIDLRTLSDAKIQKNQYINTWWVNANATFFAYAGKEFSTDPLSRGNIDGINGYVTLMNDFPPNWSGVWKANDNTTIEMIDVEVWKEFYAAMVAQGNANFLHAQQLKAQLNVAQTISEVEAITW